MSQGPTLPIVIGIPAGGGARRALDAWISIAAGHPVEIIAVGEESGGTRMGRAGGDVVELTAPRGALVPKLWAIGIEAARGSWIGLTTAHCVPDPSWIEAALAITAGTKHAGIGGVIDAPDDGAPIDWALFFARYSAYMPPLPAGEVDEIPGDNALYRADALDRAWRDREPGFWEPLVHRVMRGEGETLVIAPELQLRVGRSDRAWPHLLARFRHGRHFGSTRPGSLLQRVVRFGASPLLPAILSLRIVRRVRQRRPDLSGRVAAASPWLFAVIVAWSLGEATGYLLPGGTR